MHSVRWNSGNTKRLRRPPPHKRSRHPYRMPAVLDATFAKHLRCTLEMPAKLARQSR